LGGGPWPLLKTSAIGATECLHVEKTQEGG